MTAIHHLGWSGFLLDGGGARVAIDPHYSSFTEPGALPPWDLTPLDGVIFSHGHPDHVADGPALLRLHPRAWVVAGPRVARWLRREVPEAANRVEALTDGRALRRGQVTVRLLPGVHVDEGRLGRVRKLLRYARRSPTQLRALVRATRRCPSDSAVHVVEVLMPDGERVLHAAETVHHAGPPVEAEGPIDHLLLGVEPGEERACGEALRHLAPRAALLYSAHERTREVFSSPVPIDWAGLEALGARRAHPTARAAP